MPTTIRAREALVDALARDAMALLAALAGRDNFPCPEHPCPAWLPAAISVDRLDVSALHRWGA